MRIWGGGHAILPSIQSLSAHSRRKRCQWLSLRPSSAAEVANTVITSLFLQDFKNFPGETLCLGPVTVLIGANASGKSNIRDAFRFLHGIGRGYALADIIGRKYGAGGQVEWEPIRGAPQALSRLRQAAENEETHYGFRLSLGLQDGASRAAYTIGLQNDARTIEGFRVIEEALELDGEKIYTSDPEDSADPIRGRIDGTHLQLRMGGGGERGKRRGALVRVRPNQPGLTQIAEHKAVTRTQKEAAEKVVFALRSMRFLDLTPSRMRQPASPGQKLLGDSGENLPAVLRSICAEPTRRKNLIDWVRELTSMDVADLEFPVHDLTGQIHLLLREGGGRKLSADSISDGTLRFLAMLAALLEEDAGGLYFFEAIDQGMHPARLQLLLELLETQAGRGRLQIVATTHSPALLALLSDTTFAHTSIVCRLPGAADAIIRPVAELPKAGILRRSQGLDRLQVSGWMENALAFVERREDAA